MCMARYNAERMRQNINNIMSDKGLNTNRWSTDAGRPTKTLSSFLGGKNQSIGLPVLYDLADAAGITVSELLGEQPPTGGSAMPYWGEVPAGVPQVIEEPTALPTRLIDDLYVDHREQLPRIKAGRYVMRVRGNSMNCVAADGQFIVINPNIPPIDELANKFVIASYAGECTFKRLRLNPLRLEPYSNDPDYEAIFPQQAEDMRIIGVVEMAVADLS